MLKQTKHLLIAALAAATLGAGAGAQVASAEPPTGPNQTTEDKCAELWVQYKIWESSLTENLGSGNFYYALYDAGQALSYMKQAGQLGCSWVDDPQVVPVTPPTTVAPVTTPPPAA